MQRKGGAAEAKRIAIDGAGRTVIDRPFAEARDLVAGFSIWQVKDMDDAVAWAKRCPNPMPGPSEIEIRPFHEAADLAELLTPEERGTRQARRRLTPSAGAGLSPPAAPVIPTGAERSEAQRRDLFLSMHRQEQVPRLRRPSGGSARDDGNGLA